jgi:hypothetical protein
MDQMLSNRSLTPTPQPKAGPCDAGSGAGYNGGCDSASQCGGADSLTNGAGAPFNTNDYIRKDSIPCYGCTLPQ